ncbi:MAG: MFS transporter [Chloroflexi bacterium]|nr:MFS transporter [Chloroflexota bacterium]
MTSRTGGLYYGYIVAAAGFLTMFAMWGTFYTFGVFFKPVLEEFGWNRAMTSGAYSLSTVLHGMLGVAMGRLTDKFGPRLVMVASGVFLGAGYLLMSQIGTLWHFYLFYGVLIGIGMGGSWVPILTTVARWFINRRGMMVGIVLTGISLGAVIMPPLAERLVASYEWRASYVIMGSVALVLIVAAALFLRRDPRGRQQNESDERIEARDRLQSSGLSFVQAIRTRQLWIIFAMVFCLGFFIFAALVHIVPHATDLGISAASAANMLAIVGGIGLVTKFFIGSAVDRFGTRICYLVSFLVATFAFFWLLEARELWALYLFAVLFGMVYSGAEVLETPLIAELFGLSSMGVILSISALGFTVGGAVGPLVAGRIFDITGSYDMAFVASGIVGIIGIALTLLLRPLSRGEPVAANG